MSSPAEARPSLDTQDQRIVLHGVSWQDYERILEVRGDSAGVRMTYLRGELELMSPSRGHEGMKCFIGRLLEAYADERGTDINAFGSWTIRSQPRERGVEPDECYLLGEPGDREQPDLAIEVEWTRGLLDKLEVYRGLGVAELWIWRNGRIDVHVLRGDAYERVDRSCLFPALDLDLLTRYLEYSNQSEGVRAYRRQLRGGK